MLELGNIIAEREFSRTDGDPTPVLLKIGTPRQQEDGAWACGFQPSATLTPNSAELKI